MNSFLGTISRMVLIAVYASLVFLTYTAGLSDAFYFLTLPWSGVITIFGMLIIHTSSYGIDDFMLMGGVVNILCFTCFALPRKIKY